MDFLHRYLTDKFDWYEQCMVEHSKAVGSVHIKPPVVQLLKQLERGQRARMALLAVRMGVTRRRVSQIAAEGVAAGVLEVVADPDDARVSIVRLSPSGQAICDAEIQSLAAIEAELKRRIGRERFAELVALLRMDWGPAVLDEDSPEPRRPAAKREKVR